MQLSELHAALLTYTPDEVWALPNAMPYTYRLLRRSLNHKEELSREFVCEVGTQRDPVSHNWQKLTIALRLFKDIHRGALREACDEHGIRPLSPGFSRADYKARYKDWCAVEPPYTAYGQTPYNIVSNLYYQLSRIADKKVLAHDDLGVALERLANLSPQAAKKLFVPIAGAWITEISNDG